MRLLLIFILMISLDLRADTYNESAYIPPQCYVDVSNGDNTCFACHVNSKVPNFVNDQDTQLSYTFPEYALRNRWENAFVDRSQVVKNIPDQDVQDYISKSNYTEQDNILLSKEYLDSLSGYDLNGNGVWDGWVPDAFFYIDNEGFDRNPVGGYTGWRSFLYMPLPGLFVPSSGSFGDALIRLPAAFQSDTSGEFSIDIYKLNLSILESLIKQRDIAIDLVNESSVGVDLDRNGVIGDAEKIRFIQNRNDGSGMRFVGLAGVLQSEGDVRLAAGLYPVGTEFIHSLRYLDYQDGKIVPAERMKELRYSKKIGWVDVDEQRIFAEREALERERFPDQLNPLLGNIETGVYNGLGWRLQAFIEDENGALRPQTEEEHLFCVGCHSALGVLVDGTFSFHRKLDPKSPFETWSHWSQGGLDYVRAYLEQDELYSKYRKVNDRVIDYEMDDQSAGDLEPEYRAGISMNKAYWLIVQEQSFNKGRDSNYHSASNLLREVKKNESTGIVVPTLIEKK